ncbi:MAG: Type fimbrial biosis protein PilV [Betaproteobacteria bacterium]|nr:Type fimbrial biosis protein PilV [Betaproteobacteria bacterium]
MIEVLVAVLILALGMMGMLGMFINSLKITGGAMYRNIATQHAYMMADVIRANVANLPNYLALTTAPAATNAPCYTTAGCAYTTMPNAEYTVWTNELVNLLPAGQGKVCRDSASNLLSRSATSMSAFLTCDNSVTSQVVVKVCWDESRIRTGNAGVTNSSVAGLGGAQCVYTNL